MDWRESSGILHPGLSFGRARSAKPILTIQTGMDSLLRKQQDLDRSIAGLKRFSTTSTRLSTVGGEPESVQSAFTLSNFPDIPFLGNTSPSASEDHTRAAKADTSQISLPLAEVKGSNTNDGSLVVGRCALQASGAPGCPLQWNRWKGSNRSLFRH